jgi:peptidoglycan/LPS O-acetylase OafA/YrhL
MFLRDTVRRICCCICPSYNRNGNDVSEKPAPKLRPSAALDGFRGFAALSVFFSHILFSYTDSFEYGYGNTRSEKNDLLIQLPFIKLAYSGHAMVVVFFVIGGYVGSLGPLKTLHSKQHGAFLNRITSSVFRRSFRLYIPAIAISFITMLTMQLGLWEYQRQFITADRKYIRFDDNHFQKSESFWAQIKDWGHETKALTNVFNYYNVGIMMPYYNHYDPHLWTIPVEYRSGMLLSLIMLTFSRCRIPVRMSLMFLTMLFVGMWERWELVCFLSGSLLCEIDLLMGAGSERPSFSEDEEPKPLTQGLLDQPESLPSSWPYPTASSSSTSTTLFRLTSRAPSRISRITTPIAFVLGLYLLSAPSLAMDSAPGYIWLSSLIPSGYTDPKRFPYTLGALLVVYALMRSSTLRKPFMLSFPQYLGKISFALYVVHGPMIHIVGLAVTPAIWKHVTGLETTGQWIFGLFLGSVVLVACVMVAADTFWRTVEVWSINVARRVESWCFESVE